MPEQPQPELLTLEQSLRRAKDAIDLMFDAQAAQKRPARGETPIIGGGSKADWYARIDEIQREFGEAKKAGDNARLNELNNELVRLQQPLVQPAGQPLRMPGEPERPLTGEYPPTADQLGTFVTKGPPGVISGTTYRLPPSIEALPAAMQPPSTPLRRGPGPAGPYEPPGGGGGPPEGPGRRRSSVRWCAGADCAQGSGPERPGLSAEARSEVEEQVG